MPERESALAGIVIHQSGGKYAYDHRRKKCRVILYLVPRTKRMLPLGSLHPVSYLHRGLKINPGYSQQTELRLDMKTSLKLLLIVITALAATAYGTTESQVEGLWIMERVQVGGKEMTPIAKWTHIHSDGTYESGNGWLKSSEGTWTYDPAEQTFLPEETNGLIDPFGAFKVTFEGENMKWTREEERVQVTVTMRRSEELPIAPADQVQGLWDLTKVNKNGQNITDTYDPENNHYLFIRWDRVYVERTPEGDRNTGYWHMNGHNPEMTILSHNPEQASLNWTLQFEGGEILEMRGASESNEDITLFYSRIREFPD